MLSEYIFYRLGKRRARKAHEDDLDTLEYMLENRDIFTDEEIVDFMKEIYD